MFGTVILIAASQYLMTIFSGMFIHTSGYGAIGLSLGTFFISGIIGAFQFARTEARTMRIGERIYCSFISVLVLILAPIAITSFLFGIPTMLQFPSMIPSIIGNFFSIVLLSITIEGLILLPGVVMIFLGLCLGLWGKAMLLLSGRE